MARGGRSDVAEAAPLVTVIGDALLDVRVAPTGPMQAGADVPASVDVRSGGQGSNIAVRLARRGVRVRLVTRLGRDASGNLVREALAADGVEVVDLGASRTGAVAVILDRDGERTMLSQRVPLLAGWLDPALVAETEWLVVSGYVLLEAGAGLSASGTAPRRAIAGCALGRAQVDGWAASVAALQPHLVVLNLAEARVLAASDGRPAELSRDLGQRFGALVVVTHAAGAAVVAEGEVIQVEQERSCPARDTTGAGDGFTAVLVAELLGSDWPPPSVVLRAAMDGACAFAAAVTQVDGPQGRVSGEWPVA